MRRLSFWLWGLVCLLLSVPASAQETVRPGLEFNFARQNDFTFGTALQARYQFEQGNYSLDANIGHSNIYNLSQSSEGFVQLYFRSSIWQHYRISEQWAAASWIETDQYFDSRNEKVNLYLGARWTPHPSVRVTPLLGYAWDVRTAILGRTESFVQVDEGLTPALLLESQHVWEDQNLAVGHRDRDADSCGDGPLLLGDAGGALFRVSALWFGGASVPAEKRAGGNR